MRNFFLSSALVLLCFGGFTPSLAESVTPESKSIPPKSNSVSPDSNSTPPESKSISPNSNSTSPDSNSIPPESNSVSPDSNSTSPESKSITPESKSVSPDSNAISPESTSITPDTASLLPDSIDLSTARCFHIRLGWSLGKFALFDGWMHDIPDSAGEAKTIFGIHDSGAHSIKVTEEAKGYSSYFPIGMALSFPRKNGDRINVGANFFGLRKKWLATLNIANPDTAFHDTTHYSLETSASVMAASIGIDYDIAIPDRYFSVTGMDNTWLRLGVAAWPAVRWYTRQVVDKKESALGVNGMGVSWTAGITVVKKPGQKRTTAGGSLTYSGAWFGRFKDNSNTLSFHDIDRDSDDKKDFSMLTHRIVIIVDLIVPKRPAKKAAL